MDSWNTTFLLGRPIFRGELLVSGRVIVKLVVWGPVVWIPNGSPNMKGIGNRGIPSIPNHQAPAESRNPLESPPLKLPWSLRLMFFFQGPNSSSNQLWITSDRTCHQTRHPFLMQHRTYLRSEFNNSIPKNIKHQAIFQYFTPFLDIFGSFPW